MCRWVGADTGVCKWVGGMQWCGYIGVQVDRGGYSGMSQSVLSPHRIGVYTSIDILDLVLKSFPGSISMHMWRLTDRKTYTHTHQPPVDLDNYGYIVKFSLFPPSNKVNCSECFAPFNFFLTRTSRAKSAISVACLSSFFSGRPEASMWQSFTVST